MTQKKSLKPRKPRQQSARAKLINAMAASTARIKAMKMAAGTSKTTRVGLPKSPTLRDLVGAARDNGMDVKIKIAVDDAAKAFINDAPQPKATRFDTAGILGERAHQFAEEQFRAYNFADVKDDAPNWGKVAGYNRVHGYFVLEEVLARAYNQAASGKGYDRHGRGAAFDVQPTQVISSMLDTDAGLAFQAIKKVNEGMRLEHDAKIKEMLGAINYIASIVIYMEANKK
jgi:hypothetical protein